MHIGWVLTTLACILKVFAPSVGYIIFANFWDGFGTYSSNTITIMIMCEISNGKFRKITSGFLFLGYTLCPFYVMALSYGFNSN